jgi:MauM/NapG family ferredoxin protein
LAVFFVLFWMTAFPLVRGVSLALYLRLDPLLALGTNLAARSLAVPVVSALAVLGSAFFLGRAFCGYVCPMGATLDAAGPLCGSSSRKREKDPAKEIRLKGLKYLVLTAMTVAALSGVSLVFWGSPLALVTRFYALAVAPAIGLFTAESLDMIRPLAKDLGLNALAYAKFGGQRYTDPFFIAAFFLALFLLGRARTRFWCRYLCPAGAMMALLSVKPLITRNVSDACTACGACRTRCPMAAIPENPASTLRRECILCKTCQRICPEKAISFGRTRAIMKDREADEFAPSRRRFLAAGSAGAALAALSLTGLGEGAADQGAGGRIIPVLLIRPPGAPPEADFLRKCARCGACMRVCPTNMLQPDWFVSGFSGLFSPLAVARRGGCQALCNACGQVCPSGAIPPLPLEEKMWAKMGAAVIDRRKCLAWEQGKQCLVCDEVCPYNALRFMREDGIAVAVPHVLEDKCAGCGLCERHCPVESPAIVVSPAGAVRLAQGSFREYGREIGLSIELRPEISPETSSEDAGSVLPPGFSE